MPAAIAQPIREEIVTRHEAGETLVSIAQDLQLSYRTVRGLWTRYRQRGHAGLPPDYARCGPTGPRFPPAVQEAALKLKREHPRWGAGLVRLLLAEQCSDTRLPSRRTLQAWFRQAGLSAPRHRKPSAARARGREAHEVWELDAKEHLRLADGSESVVFAITDEATGAVLATALFPPA
jgi:transposase